MAVALVLIVFLLQVFSTATNTWQNGETRMDAYREARAALQLMSRDLQETIPPEMVPAVTPAPGATPFPVSSNILSNLPVLVLDKYSQAGGSTAGDTDYEEAYLLSALPKTGAPGDLCAVGYSCYWDDTRRTYVLGRQYSDSTATFKRLQAARGDRPVAFLDVYSRQGLVSGEVAPVLTEMASYVWDLQFRIDTSLMALSSATAEPPTDRRHANKYGVTPPYPDLLPAFVEIRFKALSTSAGKRLEGNPAVKKSTWTDTSDPLYINTIRPSVQQFTARVPLINYNAASAAVTPTPTP